jgi:CubicO group peptidase (beta-lactamase class C family)
MKALLVMSLAVSITAPASSQRAVAHGAPDAAFTRELLKDFRLLALPGMSVAVVHDGKTIYRLNQGYADVEKRIAVGDKSIFAIASVTKSFSGVMMMQYEQEGKLSLDDHLLSYPFDSQLFSPHFIDPDTRLKHVLSMTSGGVLGKTFSYDGGRFGLLTGVFEKMSGRNDAKLAYAAEVEGRILRPLHMSSTFDGWANMPTDLGSRVVKRYDVRSDKDSLVFNNVPYDANSEYPSPAAGLFSTIDDLAAYSAALDDDKLIAHDRYVEMTSPFPHDGGKEIPYGFGWLTQTYRGITLNWAYGEGNQDAALLLRVPEQKLTFIFLSNSGSPSHAARLQSGNVLRSPFAIAFLKRFVLAKEASEPAIDYDRDAGTIRKALHSAGKKLDPIHFEELYTQALVRNYMRLNLNVASTKPEELTKLLYELHPQSFDDGELPLLVLLSRTDTSGLRDAAKRLIRSFDTTSDVRPEALYFLGKYYEHIGDSVSAMNSFHSLADRPDFVDEGAKIDASLLLGRLYIRQGDVRNGREYIWKSALGAWDANWGAGYLSDMIAELKRNEN